MEQEASLYLLIVGINFKSLAHGSLIDRYRLCICSITCRQHITFGNLYLLEIVGSPRKLIDKYFTVCIRSVCSLRIRIALAVLIEFKYSTRKLYLISSIRLDKLDASRKSLVCDRDFLIHIAKIDIKTVILGNTLISDLINLAS